MNKKTIRDVDLKNKRVLMRVDFNVPLNAAQEITDPTRVQAALPSINYILEQGASLVLMSHLDRPKGKVVPEMSLKPVAAYLGTLIANDVKIAPATVGPEVDAMVAALQPGQVLILENTRFQHTEEGKKCEKEEQIVFAKQLAAYGDVYVNDAFGTAHRAHASTAVVCDYMETNVAGFLMEKELEFLIGAIENAKRPFIAIVGGAKVSGKLEVLTSLIQKVDTILIGGGMAYTFLKAQGHDIGGSLCEDDLLDTAREILAKAKEAKVGIMLPEDNVAANAFSNDAEIKVVGKDIEAGWMALDIGPKATAAYKKAIASAKTVVWNGPMGCFEMSNFAAGTMGICEAVAAADCVSIIGGGDSVSAVNKSGLAGQMSHISTGGGASLELLEGKALPGVVALDDK